MFTLLIGLILAGIIFAITLWALFAALEFLLGTTLGRLCLLGFAYWAWQVIDAMPGIHMP